MGNSARSKTVFLFVCLKQPASTRCSSRVWVLPTSILQRKISRCIYVCICLLVLRTVKLPFQSSRVIFLGRSPAEEHLPGIIQARECIKKKNPISEEQHYLCEIGLEKMSYRSSWLFKSYMEESHTHIAITAYYNMDETFLHSHTAAWGNLWDCRTALRKLVSSVYLESDLNLLFGKNGKFLFQLGYTPVVSDMKKIVQKTAALSFPQWALDVWDMDTATFYMVKYDRSH